MGFALRHQDRRIVVPPSRRTCEKRIGADDDLIDDGAVLALLHADGVRAGRREVDVRPSGPTRCRSSPIRAAPAPFEPSCSTTSRELVVPMRAVGDAADVSESLNWR